MRNEIGNDSVLSDVELLAEVKRLTMMDWNAIGAPRPQKRSSRE
jgi:hypothetical protein